MIAAPEPTLDAQASSWREIALAVDSAKRHRDWARLFRAAIELPLKYSLPLYEVLRAETWRPEDADSKRLLEQLMQDTADLNSRASEAAKPDSPTFAKMLAKGREGELATLSEAELMKRLEAATPPEGVGIVAVLARKTAPGSANARKVLEGPHWLIALAAYVCGLSSDLTQATVNHPNYWVRELASPTAVLNLWPTKASPKALEALDAAGSCSIHGDAGRRPARGLFPLNGHHNVAAAAWTVKVAQEDVLPGR